MCGQLESGRVPTSCSYVPETSSTGAGGPGLRPIPTAYLTNPRSPSSSPKSRSSISPKVFSPPYIMYLCAHTRERAAGHASGRSRGQSTLEVQPDPVRGGGSRGASTAWTQLRT